MSDYLGFSLIDQLKHEIFYSLNRFKINFNHKKLRVRHCFRSIFQQPFTRGDSGDITSISLEKGSIMF
jgi:hypothetical protein